MALAKTILLVAAGALGLFLLAFRVIPFIVYLLILHDWRGRRR